MDAEPIWLWLGFSLFVVVLLLVDLGVFHRGAQPASLRGAVLASLVWIALAMAFGAGVYLVRGPEPALEYLTGYLIEKSLSVDNIFVFTLIFARFCTPVVYQRRVLFWGILGALVMRGALIVLGTALLARFAWVVYLFGGFLVLTGLRLATTQETELHPENNPLLRLVRRVFPITDGYADGRFVIHRGGRLMVTPLLLVLVVIESSDLVFAVDSIPAIFGVTQNAFIVYTSNIFAILGLRSLYFVLAGAIGKLAYLNEGLAVILVFVGSKMLLSGVLAIPTTVALGVVALALALTVLASLLGGRADGAG